jgi:hypothetical protein
VTAAPANVNRSIEGERGWGGVLVEAPGARAICTFDVTWMYNVQIVPLEPAEPSLSMLVLTFAGVA